MPLVKTEKAREALSRRDGLLRQVDRQLLILCDGLRSEQALCAMMGQDAAAALQRLVSAGYLGESVPAPAMPAFTPPPAVGQPMARTQPELPKNLAPLPAGAVQPVRTPVAAAAPVEVAAVAAEAAPAPAPAPSSSGTRRSLAAAKVYTVGMLQLIRDPEAVEHVSTIQTSNEEDVLVKNLFASLRYLGRKAATTYCRRVSDRLLEILPEQHLMALNTVIEEIFTDVMV